MDTNKTYRLIHDIISHFDPYPIYGAAGTEVIILHDHSDMMIVQDGTGNIFHCRTDNLTTDESLVATIRPPVQPVTREQARKKRKAGPIQQQTIFL